jgi:hypothetical protein
MTALRVEHFALAHIISINGDSPRDCNNLSQLQASTKSPLPELILNVIYFIKLRLT